MALEYEEFPRDPGPNPRFAGRTIHVAPEGKGRGTSDDPCGSIAEALAQAGFGDRVLVRPGTYAEGMPGEVVALPMNKSGVLLQGVQGPQGRPLVIPRTGEHRYGITIGADHVTVVGIDLRGFVRASVLFGDRRGQRDVVLRDMTVEIPADGQWHDGILSTADNTQGGPPVITGLRIQGVTVRNASLGISCNAGPCRSWRLHDVEVEGAAGDTSGADGIAIESGENFLFTSVRVTGCSADGIDVKGRKVTIYDSEVSRVGRNGVKFWQEGDLVNSLVHHTGADAAVVMSGGKMARLRILHSLVAYHNYRGPRSYHLVIGYPDQPARVEILNSLFFRCSGGAYIAPGSRIEIRGSLWSDIDNGEVLTTYAPKSSRRRVIRLGDPARVFSKLGLGQNTLPPGKDPRLDADSFRPLPGSPLIDTGAQGIEFYPQLDASGRPRLQGQAPDIGPRESSR